MLRRLTTMLLLVLLTLVSGTVLAQDEMPERYCGDLAAADCDLLTQSDRAMQTIDSAEFELLTTLDLVDPSDSGETLSLEVMADGRYVVDNAALSQQPAMDDMSNVSMEQALTVLADMPGAVDAEVTATIELPGAEEREPPLSLTLESRLVEGIGYLNMDTLAQIPSDVADGWHGLDVLMTLQTVGSMFQGMSDGTDAPGSSGAGMNMGSELANMMNNPDQVADFMTVERLEDEMIGGTETAVYRTTFDLAAFYADDAMRDVLVEQLRSQMSMMGESPSDEEINTLVDGLLEWFSNVDFNILEYVGLSDAYRYRTTMRMDFPPMTMDEMGPGQAMPQMNMLLTLDQASFNAVDDITAPQNPTLHTLDELMSGAAGMIPAPATGNSG